MQTKAVCMQNELLPVIITIYYQFTWILLYQTHFMTSLPGATDIQHTFWEIYK